MVVEVDPGVHYQGPLPSPILTVQALHVSQQITKHLWNLNYSAMLKLVERCLEVQNVAERNYKF